ncbi:MAG: hypothetical protein KGY70_18345, partial [Bacteroidales bacterium]|nr:hypothetical protein [Bacteroidales bacterium]
DENGNGSVDPAEQFISLYPESAVPYLTKGHLHILKGEKDQAESAYRRGLKAKVDRHAVSAGVLNYYAQRLFDRNRLDEALNLLDVAENIHPEHAGLHNTRADIYREMSRRQYEKALEKDPGLEDAWEGLQEIE